MSACSKWNHVIQNLHVILLPDLQMEERTRRMSCAEKPLLYFSYSVPQNMSNCKYENIQWIEEMCHLVYILSEYIFQATSNFLSEFDNSPNPDFSQFKVYES